MITVAFFNNKGGVGKTSLVYHLAWMFADLGKRVLAADLDPQANLSSAFLDEERLEEIWSEAGRPKTVYGCIHPLDRGTGDIAFPHVEEVDHRIGLLIGDLGLSRFEDELSKQWPECLQRRERAFRVISVFWRILSMAAESHAADIVLIDVGPNLGAINRSALIASDHVVVPLAPDLFSLQGLRNLGPALRDWREAWAEMKPRNPVPHDLILPDGRMDPAGYVVMQHSVRLDRPVKAYDRWIKRIPAEFRSSVLGVDEEDVPNIGDDVWCLALMKHYRSLMPMSQEARKPVFHLRVADGAIGSHAQASVAAFDHFNRLAKAIADKVGMTI